VDIERIFNELSLRMLHDFVEQRRQEDLYLDFKLVGDPELKRDDRRNFACALSGFANSSGGIVVWGVDARKNEDGVDCAVALGEIDQIEVLLSRLNQLTGDAVDPIVNGVRHRIVATSEGRGLAASLVPESDTGPHMAKLGEHRYYKRSGDSFYRMEHFDIADMFGRRRKPRLQLTAKLQGTRAGATIVLGVKNEGRASGRAPYVAFSCDGPFQRSSYGLDGNRNEGLPLLRGQEKKWTYGAGGDVVIHPGIQHDIAMLTLGLTGERWPQLGGDTTITYVVACEDQPLTEGTLIIPLSDVNPPAR
jgi:hypothetical protein